MPAVKATSEILDGDKPWRGLSPTQYRIDSENRIVTVRLMPGEALLVERVHRAGMKVDEDDEAESFAIEDITIVQAQGEIRLEGKQARKSFVPESKKVFTLTYK
jgi:hypothetical protein